MKVASVLIPLPVQEAFDYEVPDTMSLARGDQVAVPLGPRLMRGVVAEVRGTTGSNRRLKAVENRLDDPPLPLGTVDFVEWAARWTLSPPGEMAAMALKGLRAPRPRPVRRVRRVGDRTPARPTAARTAVLDALGDRSLPGPDLARCAGVSSGVVRSLIDEGVLEIIEIEAEAAPADEAYAEEEELEAEPLEAGSEESVPETTPVTIMDFGIGRKGKSAPPPMESEPTKRGRGRPKKAY